MIYDANITSDKKIKIRTLKDNILDTYDVSKENTTVPLTRGSGQYLVQVYENTVGNKYKLLSETKIDVPKENSTDYTLMQNAHVMFTKAVSDLARQIYDSTENKTDKAIATAAANWVKKNIAYDFVKSFTIKTEEIPNLDKVLETKLGICIDKACLYAAICRMLGVKCKVCVGKVEDTNGIIYHAWNRVLIDGQWKRVDTTTSAYKTKKHIIERYY